MTFDEVHRRLVARLEEGDRGDRAWFIITRVHVAVGWLTEIAKYLHRRGGANPISLSAQDYTRLGNIIGSAGDDPGVELRRHHLLVMERPLQLLRRTRESSWNAIELSELGKQLAEADDPAEILELALRSIRFAVEPWTPPQRVTEYAAFNVPVYSVTTRVLEACDGQIDRDEFDFFLSRIRSDEEVDWAIEGIRAYRDLSPTQKASFHAEVSSRIPTPKTYQNWRDIGLHTFSLFSLGTSMVQDGQRLLLTREWTNEIVEPAAPQPAAPRPARQVPRVLRIPQPTLVEGLLTPPAAPASNDGADGESFVAKVLRSQGWQVAFYTNRRGFGFDLWARRADAAMLVEVKSSLGPLGAVTLTDTEYQAARKYGPSYVLALVENLESDSPRIVMIQDPVASLTIQRKEATTFVIARRDWSAGR